MSPADRVSRIASQLLGDLDAADSLMCPTKQETEQQKLQLIIDAFEQVGLIAIETNAKETAETTTR